MANLELAHPEYRPSHPSEQRYVFRMHLHHYDVELAVPAQRSYRTHAERAQSA